MKLCDIELRCADSAEAMGEYADGSFDCVLTSPPFQSLRVGVAEYHSAFDFAKTSQHLERLLNPDGGTLIWQIGAEVKQGIKSTVPEENLLAFKALGLHYHDDILYLKSSLPFHSATGKRHANAYEHCYVLFKRTGKAKGIGPAVVSVLIDRPNSTGGRVEAGVKRPMFSGRTNSWLVHSGNHKSTLDPIAYPNGERFSAVMPEKLTGALIETFSAKGQRLLDCFGGVFSTAKLAILNQRRCVCIERSPETFKVGVQRIESMDLKALGLRQVVRKENRVGWNWK